MYLYASKYVSGWDSTKDKNFAKILKLLGMTTKDVDKGSPHLDVYVTVGYWRKANSIHSWFVQNVQEGKDNCAKYYVPREALEKLMKQAQLALEAYDAGDTQDAEDLMTPKGGFFFGNTDINEWWREDMVRTIEIVERCLKLEGVEFYYQSSW